MRNAIIVLMAVCVGAAHADELVLSDFETLERWDGLVAETEVVHEGEQAGLWTDVPTRTSASYTGVSDWSECRGISVWIHCDTANDQRIDLLAFSHTQGLDYFQHHIRLTWTGWKHFVFPFYVFGRVRQPAGWHQIDRFSLSATWMDEPREDTVVRLDDMRLVDDVPEPFADPMSDRELIERLDVERPGMERVRELAEEQQWQEAALGVIEYYRGLDGQRYHVSFAARPPEEPPGYDTSRADRYLRHEFSFYNSDWYHVGEHIDWEADPVGDIEWPVALNRHGFLRTLARAWWHTGDERYARGAGEIVRQWIAAARVPRVKMKSMYWRTLDTGIRMDPWAETFVRLLRCEAVDDRTLVQMLKMFWHQAEFLMEHHGGGNWLVMESAGLLTAALLLPELERAQAWEAEALERLTREIDAQTYPSGAQFELTPHYHMVTVGSFRRPLELMRLNGREMPEEYRASLERMHAYLMWVSKPDRHIPMLNDSDHGSVVGYLRTGAEMFGREDMRWVASDGAEGSMPERESVAMTWAGQYVMRGGWGRDDLYLLLDAGPFGHGHQHEDRLCIDTHAYGADLVIDPGRYTYAGGKWRGFFVGSAAHNVVLVDGGGQRRRGRTETYHTEGPMPVTWASGERFDYARGGYEGPFAAEGEPRVTHTRAIWFVKPRCWVIADFLRPADGQSHRYEALWHFAPGEATVEGARVRFRAEGAGALLQTLAGGAQPEIVEGREEPVQGWVSWDYGLKQPAPTAIYAFEGADADAATVLLPFPGDAAPQATITREEASGGVAVRVADEEGAEVVVFRAPEADEIAWGEYISDAEAFSVSLNAAGEVSAAAFAGGTHLTGAGLSLEAAGDAAGEWEAIGD